MLHVRELLVSGSGDAHRQLYQGPDFASILQSVMLFNFITRRYVDEIHISSEEYIHRGTDISRPM